MPRHPHVAREGIWTGILAGVVFAAMEVLAAVAMGNPPLMPFRAFASVVLGAEALTTVSAGAAFLVGAITHLVLSGLFGLIYGLYNGRLPLASRTHYGGQIWGGLLYGTLLYLVNFQLIARALYPWFLGMPQLAQWLLHALFYGVPLALLFVGAERRFVRRAPAAR